MAVPSIVVPAKAGISYLKSRTRLDEAPAFAGVTEKFCE
jgi:hypothetical protein